MWGNIVENLGLKEGIAEFKEQFNKDAKATIANTQFAKDRGIDLAQLDAWEHTLQQQREELHEKTIGRAVDTLVKDETLGKLLDLKPKDEEEVVAEAGGALNAATPTGAAGRYERMEWCRQRLEEIYKEHNPSKLDEIDKILAKYMGREHLLYVKVCEKYGVQPAQFLGTPAIVSDASLVAARSAEKVPTLVSAPLSATSSRDAVAGVADRGTPAPQHDVDQQGPRPVGAASKADRAERLQQLEAEVQDLLASTAAVEARLAAQLAQGAELESRCAEVSAVSEEADARAEEGHEQVSLLRCAVADKAARITAVEEQQEHLEEERRRKEGLHRDLEASFQERLSAEVERKEQELLEEVSSLRRAAELKERQMQELVDEKTRLERKLQYSLPAAGSSEAPTLDMHAALARAFGDTAEASHPCSQLVDDPLLMFATLLLRRPVLRRAFFVASLFIWLAALRNAIAPGGTQVVRH